MVRLPRVALETATHSNKNQSAFVKATPRPLYKWKSFWLGILVLGFLGWAWWDSFPHRFIAWIPRNGQQVEFEREAGATHLAFLTGLGNSEEASFHYESRDTDDRPYAKFLDTFGASYCRVPDALVFLSYVGVWSAWLFFHWKREQKKAAA